MSAPICPVHGEGFGTPCYLCVDAENRTLRALYAEAVRLVKELEDAGCLPESEKSCCPYCQERHGHAADCGLSAVLSRPEAQEVLRG